MAAFLEDLFTDADGTLLENHTPGTGGAWVKRAGVSSLHIQSNAVAILDDAASDTALYHNLATPPSPDYWVEGVLVVNSDGRDTNAGVCARLDTDTDTYYHLRWRRTDDVWQIYRFVDGSATLLGSWPEALVDTDTRTMRLEVSGTGATVSVKGYVDGVERITFDDTDANRIVTTGVAGVRLNAVETMTDQVLDSITADVVATGGTPPGDITDLAVSLLTEREHTLTWTDVADETEYRVYRSTVADAVANGTLIDTIGSGLETYKAVFADPGPTYGQEYFYQVIPANAEGTGTCNEVSLVHPAAPTSLTRQNAANTPSLVEADLPSSGIYWLRPYRNDALFADNGGKAYTWFWSSDHSGEDIYMAHTDSLDPASIKSVTQTKLSLTGETPFYVHNPDDPNGRVHWLYYHRPNSGYQETFLATSADLSTWVEEGIAIAASDTYPHTGYAKVRRNSATDWEAWHLTDPGTTLSSKIGYSTSTDGLTFTIVNGDLDRFGHMPTDPEQRAMGYTLNRFFVDGTEYHLSTNGIWSDTEIEDRLAVIEVGGPQTLVAPHWDLWKADTGRGEQLDVRIVHAYNDGAGTLHVYWTDQDPDAAQGAVDSQQVWYATVSVDASLPATVRPYAVADNTGGWVDQLGSSLEADLVAAVSEEVADDTDYVVAPGDGDPHPITYTLEATPAEADLEVAYRYEKQGTGTVDLKVELLDTDGTTVLATQTHVDIGVVTEATIETTSAAAGEYQIRFTENPA